MIQMRTENIRTRLTVFVVALFVAALVVVLPYKARVGARQKPAFKFAPYSRAVPNIDPSLTASALRQPTNVQLAAAQNLKSNYGQQLSVRWNAFSGSPDAVTNFHTPPSAATPEATARAFVNSNSALFGVSADALTLVDQKEALGGYLLRFQQKVNGVDVAGGGLGFLMNSQKQIRMVSGSTFRDVSVSGATALDAAAATQAATQALAQYAASRPAAVDQLQAPAYDELAKQLAPVLRAPRLNVYPTADGYRLAWNVITFSRNPFGLFVSQIDAADGNVIARENLVRAQTADVLPYTADIYPNHPTLKNPDTGELALDAAGEPDGLKRVQLRGYNPGTNATGVEGLLSGTHALIKNVLAVQQPFPQAAQGTFHFRQNNAPLEAQPNEADDFAEPAEHIDDVNIFFFINYLLEYVDDIHKRDDSVNNRIGTGSFPDTYPNYDRPLVGLPHFPNDCGQAVGGPCDTSSADALKGTVLGLDNAFSLPVIETVDTPAGPQKVVVNPTVYGHGYLFNDLGKDGAVCYHEGMHSISTPIAGLEGVPEGSALNEAQADLWAYTITDSEAIGEYVAAGAGIRKEFRDAGRDPDSLAWIRSVHSTMKYSQLGTEGGIAFEEHRDGEIFVATMWDLRYLMTNAWSQKQFNRPAFIDGKPTRQISLGQEMWERDFLGSLYILGLTAPDTFVKARDAMIMADRILYPSDATDLEAPGQHEALIWQVYGAHEIGLNAQAPIGGRQTISTAVPQFALSQAHTAAPQGVNVQVGAQAKSIKVNWQPVAGAVAYEVFKRKIGAAGQRQYKGVAGREYFDGDNQTSGWSHIAFVANGQTTYEDSGKIEEFFAPAGIKSTNDATGFNPMFGTEYAVRAVSINANRQAGFSDLSGGAALSYSFADVTSAIQTAASNFSFADGKFEFDQTIKSTGVSGADPHAYAPIDFRIVSISDPTVTAVNADNGGDGQTKPASYVYNQTLDAGQTSVARHFAFNDPNAQMFSFDAVVTARVRGASAVASGSQSYDGDGGGRSANQITSTTDTYSGLIVVGSGGSQVANGVDYVDVPFVAKAGAFGVQGSLTATPNASAAPDLDFALLDDQGNVLATSGNLGPNESLGAGVTPGRTYVYRVIGYASGPAQFTITSEQFVSGGATGAGGTSGGSSSSLLGATSTSSLSTSGFLPARTGVSAPTHLVRFTVNPQTGAVTTRVLR
jgi:hypothetical protein